MALDIWETDPDNKPAEREAFDDGTVGRFHSGFMDRSDPTSPPQPVSLSEWRFSSESVSIADAVAERFGGTSVPDITSGRLDVFTTSDTLPIILAGPDAINADMKQWSPGNTLMHHCTGKLFLAPEEKAGKLCGCPALFAERKQAAKDYIGPSPSIQFTFRLADARDLGEFKFVTGSWTLAAILHEYTNAVQRVGDGGPVVATLSLELVSYVAKKGKMRGKLVEYTKPVLKVICAENTAA